jgi:catechol 2,3-dioxygenase-like lactoylglutathione lyase family enzyme
MTIPARVSFVTLAVRDMPRMQRFYRQFGWPESKFSDDSFAAFQCGGAVLGLYGAGNYTADHGAPPPAGSFKGFVLALNCRDAAEVDRIHEAIRAFDDITVHGDPRDMAFGGRSFEWSDPEGNLWEVTWAEGTSFDERGGLIFP